MDFFVYCLPEKRVVEVTNREAGEQCENVRQTSGGRVLSDEKTGPDCDQVHETT